ncbi:hypothetical protein GCM10027168_59920 [Streptomyces capparidis]
MGRPTDWQPLASSDPVPGDAQAVADEALRMSRVAGTIREQVDRLRTIARATNLVGKYKDKICDSADELAGMLDKTAGRYQEVSGHLSAWANELRYAQDESVKALNEAKAADDRLQQLGPAPQRKPDDPPPTKAERDAEESRKRAEGAANGQLEAARHRLNNAVNHRDTKEGEYAAKIRKSIDDDVADSWWEDRWQGVDAFIDKHADKIKVLLDAISIVVTVLGVIAMFVPGLNLIVLGLGALVVAGRLLLYATGNASLKEVLMDAAGLLLFGVGKAGMRMLRGAGVAARNTAKASRASRIATNKASTRAERMALARKASDPRTSAAARRGAQKRLAELKKSHKKGVPSLPRNEVPKVGRLGRILNQNDTEGLEWMRWVGKHAQKFPEVATGKAYLGYSASVGTAWTGLGLDAMDKIMGKSDLSAYLSEQHGWAQKPYDEGYTEWKEESWKAPVEASW